MTVSNAINEPKSAEEFYFICIQEPFVHQKWHWYYNTSYPT